MERIDSCHSIWLFDTERMRFRRVPKETSIDTPALESDWEPYYGLEISPESGAFAVAQLGHSWPSAGVAASAGASGSSTGTGMVSPGCGDGVSVATMATPQVSQ